MNTIFDGLPDTVSVNGVDVPITTDYRTGILFEAMVKDPAMSEPDILETALRLYFGDDLLPLMDVGSVNDFMEAIIWFYRCGDETPVKEEHDSKRVFDYDYDANYIYQAFMSAYGIDLATDPLHWWKFRALFGSLPEECMFMKVVGYRAMKIPPKATKQQKEFYQKMKRVYALPLPEAERQVQDDLTQALMTGKGLEAVLN